MGAIGSTSDFATVTGGSGGSDNLVNPTIVNLAVGTSEVSYAFPASTRTFFLQNRNDGVLELRHVSASVEYVTIFPGQVYSADFLNAGSTIYLKASKAAQTVEIEYWLKL